jgi:hypothetical protein
MKFFILIFFLSVSSLILGQEKYTNTKYNFSVTFPEEWKIKEGKNNPVVEASYGNYVNVYIQVQKLDIPDTATINNIKIDTLKQQIEDKYLLKFNNCSILKYFRGIIDSIDAYCFFVLYADEYDGIRTKYMSFQYQLIYKQYFYSLIATCPYKNYNKYEPVFNHIYSSFFFIR